VRRVEQRLVLIHHSGRHRSLPKLRHRFHLLLEISRLRVIAVAGVAHTDGSAGVRDVDALSHARSLMPAPSSAAPRHLLPASGEKDLESLERAALHRVENRLAIAVIGEDVARAGVDEALRLVADADEADAHFLRGAQIPERIAEENRGVTAVERAANDVGPRR